MCAPNSGLESKKKVHGEDSRMLIFQCVRSKTDDDEFSLKCYCIYDSVAGPMRLKYKNACILIRSNGLNGNQTVKKKVKCTNELLC